MLQHLKFSLPDWILCILASVGLSVNVVQSFYLPEALSRDVLRMVLVSALVIAILVLFSFSKITIISSVVLAAAAIVILLRLSYVGVISGFIESKDPEANGPLWYLVVIICAMLIYLLSRTRLTSWMLLIVGMLAAAYFQVLGYQVYIWGALLFVFSVGAWICFIGYRRNMLRVSSVRTAFLSTVFWSAGLALICLLLGFLLWFGIVRPLQPPTQNLFLNSDFLAFNQMEQLGLIDESDLYDSSLYSDWIQENQDRLSDQMEEAAEGQPNEDLQGEGDLESSAGTQQESQGTQAEEQEGGEELGEDTPSSPREGVSWWITYRSLHLTQIVLWIILGALVLAALVVLFINRKKIWYRRKTKGMDDETYIRFFFSWYLTRIKKMKLSLPRGDTAMEYAERMEPQLRFLDATGVTWREISEIFARLTYGGRGVCSGDREKYEQFWRGFYRCCRKKFRLGWIIRGLRM